MASKKINYPELKKALWEAWRIFFASASVVILAQFEAGVNLKDWKNWVYSLGSAAIVAGLKATVKYVREKYFKGEYDHIIYKLPL